MKKNLSTDRWKPQNSNKNQISKSGGMIAKNFDVGCLNVMAKLIAGIF